jgi:hypothetical protein
LRKQTIIRGANYFYSLRCEKKDSEKPHIPQRKSHGKPPAAPFFHTAALIKTPAAAEHKSKESRDSD